MNNFVRKASPENISAEEHGENLRALHLADKVLQMLVKAHLNNDADSIRRMLQSMSEQVSRSMTVKHVYTPGVVMH